MENLKHIVRNQFTNVGKFDMPLIKNQYIDLNEIKLMKFSNARYSDVKNKNKTIQFFTYDYKFNYLYSKSGLAVEKLKQYYCLLTPDFSLYADMPLALQIKNTFKNRWLGAYWQSLGLKVIPTVGWSDERSFDFCFDGIEDGSIVAVSTHGNKRAKVKDAFMLGYNKMLKIIKPSAIICYSRPFSEMQGNIITFPYNHHEGKEVWW